MEASCCTAKPPLPSRISLLFRCCPDVCQTVQKGKQFCAVSPHHSSKEKNKTGRVFLPCPSHFVTQPRACHCEAHTLPPCCLLLQAKDSLYLRKFNQQCDEVKICPGKILLMDVCEEICKNCKELSKTYPYEAVLTTALFCPPQKQ